MTIINYYKEPPSLAWDVAAAIFGADGVGVLPNISDLSTLFQNAAGTVPALPGDPTRLVLDRSGNDINLTAPNDAQRPTLARMPKTGRRNLLTWTEDFSNSAWTSTGGGPPTVTPNNVIAPDGTMTADTLAFPTGGSGGERRQIIATQPAGIYTLSLYVKGVAGERVTIGASGGVGNSFIILDGTWQRLTFSSPAGSTPGYFYIGNWGGASNLTSVAVWGAQLELGATPTPYQRVTNAFDVTEAGVPDTYSLVFDLVQSAISATLPQAINGDIVVAGRNGTIIEPVSYASGTTFSIGPTTFTGGPAGVLAAVGEIVGVVLIDRTLTQAERDQLVAFYKAKGAGDLI